MKVLVAYDGSLDSKAALMYGIQRVREFRGELIALHVFRSRLFIDYDAGPRAVTIAQLESLRHVEEARMLIRESSAGIRASIVFAEGNEQEETLRHAKAEDVDLIVVPRSLGVLAEKACCLVDIVTAADMAAQGSPYTARNYDGALEPGA